MALNLDELVMEVERLRTVRVELLGACERAMAKLALFEDFEIIYKVLEDAIAAAEVE